MKKILHKILLSAISLSFAYTGSAQIITAYAGCGTTGYSGDGGQATDAFMYYPSDIAMDHSGNLYIADFYNNAVRKVTTDGIITTIAGTGAGSGSAGAGGFSGDGGPATLAQLNGPYALITDPAGNLYVADGYNHNVRKIDATGTITNFAGNHTAGYSGNGGQATAAALNNPVGLAIDKAGNIYIADDHNHVVRKVTPAGIISTYAGSDTAGYSGDGGQATQARMDNPIGVAVDTAGNLFIADDVNNNIRKVTPAGIISTYVGMADTAHGYVGDGGPATTARLYLPRHIACDDTGNLYISDLFNNVVRKVAAGGSHIITTFAGDGTYGYSGDGGPATLAEMKSVNGIAISPAGHIYICDVGNSAVRKIAPFDNTAVRNTASAGTNGISIVPNPTTNGNFKLLVKDGTGNDLAVIITDVTGKQMKTLTVKAGFAQDVNLKVAPGIYFVAATTAQQKYTARVVVE